MKSKAAVLTQFNEPLAMDEFDVCPLEDGEVLVKLEAIGVCGSDVHMWKGKDPRTPVPIILGHEGIGRLADLGSPRRDVLGRELSAGDLVMWDRGIVCGTCYYCLIKKMPGLCPSRQTYGISLSCKEPPHLRGCYSEYIHLFASTPLLKIDGEVDPKVLVPASCSGATAASTVEQCDIRQGDTVVVIGAGPVGIFVLAFAMLRSGCDVYVLDRDEAQSRLDMCAEFGAIPVNVSKMSPAETLPYIRDVTQGRGADVVIDCTGSPKAAIDGIKMVAPLGTYAIPGIATPVGDAEMSGGFFRR